jgi:Domain of unknown function (DUF1508)
MAAKFVLKKGSTGKFRFNLVATNGQVIPPARPTRVRLQRIGWGRDRTRALGRATGPRSHPKAARRRLPRTP